MADIPEKPVLVTGAAGALGRVVARGLGALGWKLVLTDIAAFRSAAGGQPVRAGGLE